MKALAFHPDRNSGQNLALQQSMVHQFIDVHEAYKNLVAYLEARDQGLEPGSVSSPHNSSRRAAKEKRPASAGTGDSKEFYREKAGIYRFGRNNIKSRKNPLTDPPLDPKSLYRGPMPNCPLLFGRYLYYSGIISLHTIGQALVWQRSQRPRLGEIGRRFGWLTDQDTFKILRYRHERKLFGELALRLGLLTVDQLHTILLQQKKLHKRIGQYFIEKNYWDGDMLGKYIAAHMKHNARLRNSKFF